ncbi:MAG: hypothetical protein GWP06_00530 [Actinobacteria bacterium]|nr:hypothetical protein [Actinomycetota bacterium]
MKNQFKEFMRVLQAFEKQKVNYVLIGGVAMILYGMERLTRDVDVFVEMIPENIERLRKALNSIYKDASINEISMQELDQYSVIRYGTPNGFNIDMMSRIGEAVSFNDLEYETVEYKGTKIRIATPETLFNLKKDTVRQKDKVDAFFLNELIKKKDHQ